MKFYDYRDSGNGYKCRLLFRFLDLPVEVIEMDILKGETRQPAFLAINPDGRIPVLVMDDGRVLPESNAILFHFAEGTRFMPADPWDRAQAMRWMFFEQYRHEPNIAVARFLLQHTAPDDPRREALAGKQAEGARVLAQMEAHLAGRDFLVGDACSLADIALFAYTHVADEGGFDMAPFGAIAAWIDRVKALPGWAPMATA